MSSASQRQLLALASVGRLGMSVPELDAAARVGQVAASHARGALVRDGLAVRVKWGHYVHADYAVDVPPKRIACTEEVWR